MKLRQLAEYSGNLLKNNRMKALLVCLMFLGTELFFRLAEAALLSVILYVGETTPIGLFTGESPVRQAVTLVCMVLRYLTTAPLSYACAYWFTELCSDRKKRRSISVSGVLLSGKIYGRSLAALLLTKLAGMIFLLPAMFFGSTVFSLVSDGIENSDDFRLFMSVHAAVMTLVSVGLWIWAKLAMTAVPYLLVHFPKQSVFSIVRNSFSFMKHRRATLLKIFLRYAAPMLLIVTIPFLLPKLFVSTALFISISIKEDEYLERNKTDCNLGQAAHAPELPARTKRRFTPPADKAQTAGYGDNP